jgi:5-methylcytosine-specific restriction endonuclease McrA
MPTRPPTTSSSPEARRQANRARYEERRGAGDVQFFASAAWKATRVAMLSLWPICQRCKTAPSTQVHHREARRNLPRARWLDRAVLECLCASCHSSATGRGE